MHTRVHTLQSALYLYQKHIEILLVNNHVFLNELCTLRYMETLEKKNQMFHHLVTVI